MCKVDILSLSKEELTEQFHKLQEPAFRVKQVFSWLHQKKAISFSAMTNIAKALRIKLENDYFIEQLKIAQKQISVDGTTKYLFALSDGNYIETVAMRYHHGISVCVSTQVGCRMGCTFCASTKNGLVRNLRPSEIVGQVYAVERDLQENITSIVLMGIGEPLDNFDNVVRFLQLISDSDGRNLGGRHISLSTCGLVPKIEELANYQFGLTLSVSLHAPFNDVRSEMMPINRQYPIEEVLQVCKSYQAKTGRRISFEYTLIQGVNDTKPSAIELAKKIKGMLAHVNLIPLNPIDGTVFSVSDEQNIFRFQKELEKLGITATVRRRLGEDISAACGQLRAEMID